MIFSNNSYCHCLLLLIYKVNKNMYAIRYYEIGTFSVIVQIFLMPMILSLLFIYDYNNNGDYNDDDDVTLSNE